MDGIIPEQDYKERYIASEERFRTIFSLTSAATKIIDESLTIIKVNKALTDLLGYGEQEICGKKILDFACAEYIDSWKALQYKMWSGGEPFFRLDACLKNKNGALVWVHVTTIIFSDGDKRFAYTVLDDFTYMKSFHESEKRLNMSLQYSRMAVFDMDTLDGNLTYSEGLREILGLAENEIRLDRGTLLDCFIPDDKVELEGLLTALSSNSSLEFTGRVNTPNGELKWVHLQGRLDDLGISPRLLATAQDITKEKKAERYKDDFISIASHELRTPMTILSGTLQLLERNKPAELPRVSGLIGQANKSMRKINTLIEDLLHASKMSEGQLHLHKTAFNISRAVEECCADIDTKGFHKIIFEGDNNLELFADPERIQQVLINFVGNAIKYAPDQENIKIKAVEDVISISVSDSGPGIDADKVGHLFDRYYRVDSDGSQYSGIGLGLYISAEIIKKHGGKIGVSSELGKGSEFWFSLPKTLPEEIEQG